MNKGCQASAGWRTAIEDKKNRLRKPYAIAMFTKNIFKFLHKAFSGTFIFTHRELLRMNRIDHRKNLIPRFYIVLGEIMMP